MTLTKSLQKVPLKPLGTAAQPGKKQNTALTLKVGGMGVQLV